MTNLEFEQTKMLIELQENYNSCISKIKSLEKEISNLQKEELPDATITDKNYCYFIYGMDKKDSIEISLNNIKKKLNNVFLGINRGDENMCLSLTPEAALEVAAYLTKFATYKYE